MIQTIPDIESRAADLLRETSSTKLPVSLGNILRHLKIQLRDFPEATGVSGALIYKEGNFYIGVNATHSLERKRFSIAHEIGHYCLHKAAFDIFDTESEQMLFREDIQKPFKDRRETQANMFAAALLMPQNEVTETFAEYRRDTAVLATLFCVSQEAIRWRCKNLGLL